MHELNADEGGLGRLTGLAPEHRTGDPLHPAMVLFDHIVEIRDLRNRDPRAKFLVVAPDRRFIGYAPIARDLLRHAMPADRFGEKGLGRLFVTLFRVLVPF